MLTLSRLVFKILLQTTGVIAVVLLLATARIVFAGDTLETAISTGNGASTKPETFKTTMMQGWYDIKCDTIGAANLALLTKYPRRECTQITNLSDAAGLLYYSTQVQPDSAHRKPLRLQSGECSGLLPPLAVIWNTTAGSSAMIVGLYVHKF
jgi:hypothetical protein